MRSARLASALLLASTTLAPAFAQSPKPFTIQQVLSAPYALALTAAPVGNRFAWIENAEGRRNIWIGSPTEPARQLTHYTEDDGQDIDNLAWSPDATSIAYTYGTEDGANGQPANPAHLQRPTPLQIILQPLAPNAPATTIGEGSHPLFTPDSHSLLFLRNGNIWIADLGSSLSCPSPQVCHPERAQRVEEPVLSNAKEPATPPALPQPSSPSTHQLVYDRGRASNLTLSPDGHLLAFISHRRGIDAPSHAFLALFNLATHELTFPAASTANDSAPTFSPDGHHLAWLRTPFTQDPEYTPHRTSPNPWSIQLLDLATNTTHQVYSPEPNKPGSAFPHIEDSSPEIFFTTGGRIIFYSEADGWTHLYRVDPASESAPQLLTPGSFEVEDASVAPGGNMLLFASAAPAVANHKVGLVDNDPRKFSYWPIKPDPADHDRRHLWRLDLNQSQPEPAYLTYGPGVEVHPHFTADGKSIIALASTPALPMSPVIIDPPADMVWSSGKMKPVHEDVIRNARDIPYQYPAHDLVTPQQILVPSTDNLTIHAELFLPPHLDPTRRHATLIFVHGGPNRQMLLGYPGMDYYSNAYAMNQYLASRGFIVLSVNYRGGIGYGLNFREAEHYGPDGTSEYNDVLAAVHYLRSRPDVDPSRIGIWGGSYGGYLTALALARNSDLFAAGVDFHGVHEWSLEGNADRFMPDPTHATSAQRDAAAALAHSSSPIADVDHWRSPVLLIHGDNDPEVNYAQTPILADALRARHVPVEELIFPDEVHGFLLHKDWIAAYEATAAFFEKVLKP